jgi:hypothetical protein
LSSKDTVELLIALFGMIGTVGAAIAAMFSVRTAEKTLLEQASNNKRALKPFIAVEGNRYELEYNESELFINLDWDSQEHTLSDNSTSIGTNLNIINISNGNAKNVKVKFSFEGLDNFIKIINEPLRKGINLYGYVGNHRFKANKNALYIDFDVETKKAKFQGSKLLEIEDFQEQSFIVLAANEKGNKNKIRIPSAYIALYNAYFYLSNFRNENELLKLIIDIKCEDIIGDKYNFKYIFKPKSYTVSRSIDKDTNGKVEFEIIEII